MDRLELLRLQLGVPAWLLVRIWPGEWRDPVGWERVIAIEPGVDPLMGIRESVPPIVGRQRVWPESGTSLPFPHRGPDDEAPGGGSPLTKDFYGDFQADASRSHRSGTRSIAPGSSQPIIQAGYNHWWEAVHYGYHSRVRWADGGNPERALRIAAGPVASAENGADVLVRMAAGRVLTRA